MIRLSGLDGSNPLAFLAAIGAITALEARGIGARLRWRDEGTWVPYIEGVESLDELIAHVMADLETWVDEPALELQYPAKTAGKIDRDLKPPPEVFAGYMSRMRDRGDRSERLAGAFATDVATDNNGATKPTSLHFTAGQQRFLNMVRDLRDGVRFEELREALEGPWLYESKLPVFGWDATDARSYALRAADPSKDKKTGNPGADWLAFAGLQSFPVVPRGARAVTTSVRGRWKTSSFTWPLWSPALTPDAVRSLLQHSFRLARWDRAALDAWGVEAVLTCRILRADQGGYGSFSPPSALR